MNYRHAFHAGNFADVFKHVVLSRILIYLRQKQAPFRVIDTHAGAGLHDLAGEEANRTGEWRDGIARLAAAVDAATIDASLPSPAAESLAPYIAACRVAPGLPRYYPGSPLIAQRLMRPQDRLIACELEPAAAAALASRLHTGTLDGCAKVLELDGWTALAAYIPPKERRGLVLVDPPYERTDEFAHLADALVTAYRKWATGIYMLWYPIKSRDGPDHLFRALRPVAAEKRLRAEIAIGAAEPQAGLRACGLIVLNPPWKLASELAVILPTLIGVLGRGAERGYVIDHLEGEPRYRSLNNAT